MGQHTERDGILSKKYHYGFEVIDLASSSSATVTFTTPYRFTPGVYVIKPRGAAGTYGTTNISEGGFDITVATETDPDYNGEKVTVFFFAHER